MFQSFYTVSNSLISSKSRLNAVSGNISNLSTDGYKKVDVNFKEALYSLYDKKYENLNGAQYKTGNGTITPDVVRDFSQGNVVKTNNPLDIAIMGEGFFTVEDGNSNIFYTRGGTLSVSYEGDAAFLTNENGFYLLDTNMEKVKLNCSTDDLLIDENGKIKGTNDEEQILRLTVFENPESLESVGDCLFKETLEAGGKDTSPAGKVMQEYVEKSNTDLVGEMTDLLKIQRLFQLNCRVIQAIDEMESLSNSIRR